MAYLDPEKRRAYYRQYYKANREKARAVENAHTRKKRTEMNALKSKPCMDCGGSFPPECIDFDHARGQKLKGLYVLYRYSRARRDAEIAKCDLVCANCHRIRTARRLRGKE